MQIRRLISTILIIVILLLSGCTSTAPPANSATIAPTQPAYQTPPASPSGLTIRVDSLGAGSPLPEAYTCKGAGESPDVAWDGIPAGTKSLVLILDDPDAPNGRFTHWIVYNIPRYPENLHGHSRMQKCWPTGHSRVTPVTAHGDTIPHARLSELPTGTYSGYTRLIWISPNRLRTGIPSTGH